MTSRAGRVATRIAAACSTWQAAGLAAGSVATWAAVGLALGVLGEDWWMMPAVTVMSIVSYIVPFVILYAQDHDTRAIQAKLDELIKVNDRASDALVAVEKRNGGC